MAQSESVRRVKKPERVSGIVGTVCEVDGGGDAQDIGVDAAPKVSATPLSMEKNWSSSAPPVITSSKNESITHGVEARSSGRILLLEPAQII